MRKKVIQHFIFALFMGFFMSLSITLVTTYARMGLASNFFIEWMKVWIYVYPVAILCIMAYRPFVMKMTDYCLEKIKAK